MMRGNFLYNLCSSHINLIQVQMDGNFYAQSFPLLSRRNHSRCFRQFHHFLLAYNIHQFIYMLSLSTCNLITILIHVSSVLTKPFENQVMQFLTLRFVWFVLRKVLSFFSLEQVISSLLVLRYSLYKEHFDKILPDFSENLFSSSGNN